MPPSSVPTPGVPQAIASSSTSPKASPTEGSAATQAPR